MEKDHPNEILEQYGCGPIQFTGTNDALYERHLIFDHVIDAKKADPREQFEAAARSIRDIVSQRWLQTEDTYAAEESQAGLLPVDGISAGEVACQQYHQCLARSLDA